MYPFAHIRKFARSIKSDGVATALFGVLFVGVLILPAPVAHAAIYQDTQEFEGITGTFLLTFDQFNPAWGTLNSVTLTFSLYSSGGALRFDNDGATPATGNVRFGVDGNFYSEDLTGDPDEPLSLVVRAQSPLTPVSVAADDGDVEVGGTAGFSTVGPDYAEVIGGNYFATRNSDMTDYVVGFLGIGTFTITAEANQFVSASAFGGAQQQIDPSSVSGTVTVTYNYTGDGPPPPEPQPQDSSTVPEPTTISLVLLALVAARRSFFRKRS